MKSSALLLSQSPFPDEVLEEIREERVVEYLNLPPCRVQLVLGLPGPQRLYTNFGHIRSFRLAAN